MLHIPQSRPPAAAPRLRYVREPKPLHFPEEEEVPEGRKHLEIRTFLFQLLTHALGPAHSVGSDQFVYWNASDPRRCLSPDVFVKLGVPDASFGSWKAWARGGPPDLAVEIISPNEGDGIEWDEKLARYHECGVTELVRFDPEERAGARLRAWDRVKDDLVERIIDGDGTPCLTLSLTWCVTRVPPGHEGLRLADDDGTLVPSDLEAQAKAREAEAKGRQAAEARVAALEAELAKLRSP